MDFFYTWALTNWIELCGMTVGFIYLWFSVKQHIFTWPLGIISSLLYIIVFFNSRFYAGMGLQFYYFFISIYGWWSWLHTTEKNSSFSELHISRTGKKLWLILVIVSVFLVILIMTILRYFTDSPIPFWDSLTTSLSIIATWMLARKKFEHWIVWMLIDSVSIILYFSRGLYPTTLLFLAYTIIAFVGYHEWRKDLIKLEYQKILN